MAKTVRILSDLHYGDRASRVARLPQLMPLFDGAHEVVLNGDTLDTRPGPRPEHTSECRADVHAFAAASGAAVTFLTGNHDPDFSAQHELELADGRVLITHGDIMFEDIVPWGRDAITIRHKITAALGAAASPRHLSLEQRYAIWRQVAATIPQRHQSERHSLKYALRFAADTIWPPLRILRILRAWQVTPVLAAQLARQHRPAAKFIILGHTHRPGVWRAPSGEVVINTGSFCPPFGGYAVEVGPTALRVRRVERRGGEFRPDSLVAEFPL